MQDGQPHAKNFKDVYQMLCDTLCDVCNIAIRNKYFDPTIKEGLPSIMFWVTDPDMIFERDQTGFTLDQTDDEKGPEEKTLMIPEEKILMMKVSVL